MKMNKLGKTDVQITTITFGAWAIGGWMWGGSDENEAIRAMEEAIDLGMTSIDTAPIYGFGYSEQLVGKVTKDKRHKVQLLTKYSLRWQDRQGAFYFSSAMRDGKPVDIYKYGGKESVLRECEDSLRRLQTDYIDLYQMHWPDDTTPIEETMEAMEILLDQGKIRACGVSNFSHSQLESAHAAVPQASNQVPYSMVKRDIEDEVVPYCIDNNISIIAYSPLQRGILTGKMKPGHHFNKGDHRPDTPYYKDRNIVAINKMLDQIRPVAESHDASLAQLVLNWTATQPGITAVLAGARNPDQVRDNARALSFSLSVEELNTIESALEKVHLDL
jgi:aryl-alcohol dehydrogenase-like predicted oxidoreductase